MALPDFLPQPFILSAGTAGHQQNVQVASFEDGSFIAVWTDFPNADDPPREGLDTSDGSIRAQIFNADGSKRGGEFLVNTTIENYQINPSVAVLSNGCFAVAWENYAPINGEPHVTTYARIFNSDGTAFDRLGQGTGDFLVNRDISTTAFTPVMTALSNGGFVVSYNVTGSMYRIKAQSFNADGTYRGSEVYVKPEHDGDGTRSSVVGLGETYAVIYSDGGDGYADAPSAIRGVIRTASGSTFVKEFTISGAEQVNIAPQATALADGRFIVVWAAGAVGGESFTFKAQIYTADGVKSGSEITLASVTDIRPLAGLVSMLDGGFAIAYYARQPLDARASDIHVATFAADGRQQGHDIVGHAGLPWPYDIATPSLAPLADGRFVVTWHARDDHAGEFNVPTDVFGRIVDSASLPSSGEPIVQKGSPTSDILTGGTGIDILIGEGGDDVLIGNGSGDRLEGGAGLDTASYRTGQSGVTASLMSPAGNTGDAAGDVYVSIERLVGSAYGDILTGNSGHNTLNGGMGADRMAGGAGNDTYYVDSRYDVVSETGSANGSDLVMSSISYTLGAYVEKLTGTGSSAIALTGNTLANALTGNLARNTLKGLSGNDTLNGGKGDDLLYGGTGNNVFVFNTAPSTTTNKDRILDWSSRDDTIQLENAIFRKLTKTGVLSSASFVIGAAAKDANDSVGYNKSTGDVWYDANGSKAGGLVVFANIGKNKAVFYNDFIVI